MHGRWCRKDGATSDAHCRSKQLKMRFLADDKSSQQELDSHTKRGVPKPSQPHINHNEHTTESVNPPRCRGQLKSRTTKIRRWKTRESTYWTIQPHQCLKNRVDVDWDWSTDNDGPEQGDNRWERSHWSLVQYIYCTCNTSANTDTYIYTTIDHMWHTRCTINPTVKAKAGTSSASDTSYIKYRCWGSNPQPWWSSRTAPGWSEQSTSAAHGQDIAEVRPSILGKHLSAAFLGLIRQLWHSFIASLIGVEYSVSMYSRLAHTVYQQELPSPNIFWDIYDNKIFPWVTN